jgi:hypothetical protein
MIGANARENFSFCATELPAEAIVVRVQVRQFFFAQSTVFEDAGGSKSIKNAESVTGDSRRRSTSAGKFCIERVARRDVRQNFLRSATANGKVRVRVFVSGAH